jgi:immunity protein 70 of polymorphic toxin system
MGLYLCVFDEADTELEGVEVGSYADFNFFRDAVVAAVEEGAAGKICPTLFNHSDNDGEWTSDESRQLLAELGKIAEVMNGYPPIELNADWKKEVAKTFGLSPKNLLECFFDVDGEPLVERLSQLAQVSISSGQPIKFQ